MEINREQFIDIANRQLKFDNYVFENHSIKKYPFYKVCLALFTEMGELLNERQDIVKYWRENPKIDTKKALEELIDCLHFAMSLCVRHYYIGVGLSLDTIYEKVRREYNGIRLYLDHHTMEIDEQMYTLYSLAMNRNASYQLAAVLAIGDILGYTWDEMYTEYVAKNNKNYERQQNGY